MMPLELLDIKQYTLLEVLPAYTYRKEKAQEQGALIGEQGVHNFHLTGKYGVTSQLILDGTWNPDFSQVEADAGQVDVNLRYDLFFPEKRPFFLEGSEMFQLAGSSEADPLLAVVHTRTIIDPRVGFKLSGKVGKKDTVASIFALDESPSGEPGYEPGDDRYAGFGILRYKRAVAGDGYLGAFYTGREYGGGSNRVAGADGQQGYREVQPAHRAVGRRRDHGKKPERQGPGRHRALLPETGEARRGPGKGHSRSHQEVKPRRRPPRGD